VAVDLAAEHPQGLQAVDPLVPTSLDPDPLVRGPPTSLDPEDPGRRTSAHREDPGLAEAALARAQAAEAVRTLLNSITKNASDLMRGRPRPAPLCGGGREGGRAKAPSNICHCRAALWSPVCW